MATYRKGKRIQLLSAVTADNGAPAVETAATGTLTIAAANAKVGETITIGATVYTWAAAAGAAFTVVIGATASDSLDNLIAAINAAAGEGTTYGTGTTACPDVVATAGAGDTMVITADAAGAAGNAIASTETMDDASWGAATLTGGSDAVAAVGTFDLTAYIIADETVTIDGHVYTWKDALTGAADEVKVGATASASIDNLIAAINDTGTEGVNYGAGTAVNSDISAAAGAGDTATLTAKVAGAAGNALDTTETMTKGEFGAAVLAGGADAVKATGTATVAGGNARDTETVTIDATVYTFAAALSAPAVPYEVLIGATASDSLDNLIAAINAAAGAGATYGTGTVAHPTHVAAAGAGDTMVVTASNKGVAGNVGTTETLTDGSWGSATATGGAARYGIDLVAEFGALPDKLRLEIEINGTGAQEADVYVWTYEPVGATGDEGVWARPGTGANRGHVNAGSKIAGTTEAGFRGTLDLSDIAEPWIYLEVDNASGTDFSLDAYLTPIFAG